MFTATKAPDIFFPPLRTTGLFPSLRVILSSPSYMLGKKRFSFTPSPATKLTFLRNICDNPHLVSLNRGEGSSTLCNDATIFQVGVNDGQQSHFHPQNITLQHTGSLSLQIVTFITKLPCTASRVVTNMKIIFT